jgi:hypothetical protein
MNLRELTDYINRLAMDSKRMPRGDVGSPAGGAGMPSRRYNMSANPAGLKSSPMRPNPFAVDSQKPTRPTPPIPSTGNPGGGITPETYIPDNLPDETIKIIMDLLMPPSTRKPPAGPGYTG